MQALKVSLFDRPEGGWDVKDLENCSFDGLFGWGDWLPNKTGRVSYGCLPCGVAETVYLVGNQIWLVALWGADFIWPINRTLFGFQGEGKREVGSLATPVREQTRKWFDGYPTISVLLVSSLNIKHLLAQGQGNGPWSDLQSCWSMSSTGSKSRVCKSNS